MTVKCERFNTVFLWDCWKEKIRKKLSREPPHPPHIVQTMFKIIYELKKGNFLVPHNICRKWVIGTVCLLRCNGRGLYKKLEILFKIITVLLSRLFDTLWKTLLKKSLNGCQINVKKKLLFFCDFNYEKLFLFLKIIGRRVRNTK